MLDFLAENMLLVIGLGFGAALVGLKALVKKTETTLDDEALAKIEENKEGIIKKISDLVLKLIRK